MLLLENNLYTHDLKQVTKNLEIPQYSRVLVTGAAGLIGSYMIDALIYYNNHEHRQLQIYGMGRHLARMKERFAYALDNPYVHLIEHDVCVPFKKNEEYDFIAHMASNADPGMYARYPVETITTNILGTLNVLEYARSHKNTKIVFASSMEVYGNVLGKDNFHEQDYGTIDYNEIRAGYPESKRTAELLVRSFVDEYNVKAAIARLGYIYGPTMTQNDNKVVAQFIRKAVSGENIVLKSQGTQRRSYCYVSDAVAGIFTVLLNGKSGEAYNVANKDSVLTIADLARTTANLVGKKVVYDLPNELEMKGFGKAQDAVLNTEKLEALGYVPFYSASAGIKRTISIMRGENNESYD